MKSWKIVVAFVLVFALLFAAYYFIEMYEPKRPVENAPKSPQIPILSMNALEIEKINVKNGEETFTFYRDENVWRVENNESAELSLSAVEALCFSAANLSASAVIEENPADLSAYGLDAPQGNIRLFSKNGEAVVFFIGNLTPAGDGFYVCLASGEKVYLVSHSVAAQFLSPLTAFRNMTLVSIDPASILSVTIYEDGTKLHLAQREKKEDVYQGAVSTWQIQSPIVRDADDVLVREKLLTPISQIVAPAVASDSLSGASEFGFAGDYVEMTTGTETLRLYVSSKNGKYYVYVGGKETVFEFGQDALSFMELTPFDILEKMTNLISVDAVESVKIDLPGAKATLSISQKGDKTIFFVNDKEAPEKEFKDFYLELAALSVDGMVEKPVDSSVLKPVATIVYTLKDKSTTTLAYYPYDTFHFAVFENSENSFFIKKTKLDDLAQKLQNFLQKSSL